MIAGRRARARQWSRTAFALAGLFGSLPLAGRIFLGNWGFDGALELACLFAFVGLYFYLLGHRLARIPDESAMLQRAIDLAVHGRIENAIDVLSRTVHLSPRFWQAYQCRAELRLAQELPREAADDLSAAIRLAPREPHLYRLRAHAFGLLGDEASAAADLQTAAGLEAGPSGSDSQN